MAKAKAESKKTAPKTFDDALEQVIRSARVDAKLEHPKTASGNYLRLAAKVLKNYWDAEPTRQMSAKRKVEREAAAEAKAKADAEAKRKAKARA